MGGVIAAFAIIIGIIGFTGSALIDDVTGGGIISPASSPREVLPLEIELDDITILEVTDTVATLEIKFKVTNPNPKSVILQMIKYELYENNVRIKVSEIGERATGLVSGSNYFTILSDQPTMLRDTITIKNTGNTPELWAALTNNNANWEVKGEAFFNLSSMTSGGENELFFEFTK